MVLAGCAQAEESDDGGGFSVPSGPVQVGTTGGSQSGGSGGASGGSESGGSGGASGASMSGKGGGGNFSGMAGTSGKSGGAGSSGSSQSVPPFLTIEIVSALVGPSKIDGTQWDGTGEVPSDLVLGLAAALGAGVFAPVFSFMVTEAAQVAGKPDPFGYTEINAVGEWDFRQDLATIDTNTEDTFAPNWPMPVGWSNVPYSENIRIRLVLKDEDLVNDDDMGVAEINAADVAAAWAAKKIYQVRVAEQTANQILYVGISVTKSN